MKHQKLDRRVSKTKNAITGALLRLMEEKPVSSITVSELTEAADINRKTFYNHYDSVDSVLGELENNCTNWVLSFVKDVPFETLLNDPVMLYKEIARGLQRHSDLVILLRDAGVYSRLADKISTNLIDLIVKKTEDEFKSEYFPTARRLLEFITAGAVRIYDGMFDTDEATTLEDVEDFIAYIFENSSFREVLKTEALK